MGSCLGNVGKFEARDYPTTHVLHLPDKLASTEVKLPPPSHTQCHLFTISGQEYSYSACALPGLYPEVNQVKECQDVVDFVCEGWEQEDVLVMLLDGHGQEGHAVACQASSLLRSFFLTNRSFFSVPPT